MWSLVVYENGVLEAEYGRYYVELKRVQKDPEFWADHLAGKIWGTPEVIDDLLSLAKRLKEPVQYD